MIFLRYLLQLILPEDTMKIYSIYPSKIISFNFNFSIIKKYANRYIRHQLYDIRI